jgi:hypothetical protein
MRFTDYFIEGQQKLLLNANYPTQPKKVGLNDSSLQHLNRVLDSYSASIVEVEIESRITQPWSQFKGFYRYIIDNIAYQKLIRYHDAKIKIVKESIGMNVDLITRI